MNPSEKKQTQKPYGSDYVDFANEQAKSIYNNTKFLNPALQPVNKNTTTALKRTVKLSKQGVPGFNNALNVVNNAMTTNGMTPEMQGVASDIRSGMDQVEGYLQPFASGQYQEDPRLQQLLDYNTSQAANATATKMGGGRYGSAAIGNAFGSAMSNANNATMLQSNENSRNRQLQAATQMGQMNLQGNGLLGQMYDNGAARSFQAASMLPALNDLRYDGASRQAGVGDYYTSRAQTNADRAQGYQWDNLGRYNAIINGNGRLGNTTTTPGPSAAQNILGGIGAGAKFGSSFGPWGTLVGAAGGGVLGAFS